ncbi:MAG: transposase [Candidatus Marinimicrobia bacterium]|nr:transposase [Candidatus Neomarinimicrobiota bacterium]
MSINILQYKEFYRGNLPHYQPQSGIFFITYRLNYELPAELVNELQQQKQEFARQNKVKKPNKTASLNFEKRQFDFIDNYLALCQKGPKYLSNPDVANIVSDSLFIMNSIQYELYCYCIMPNHVHILIKPLKKKDDSYYSLAEILKGHKGSTARRANVILETKGKFWHIESYDHLVRSQEEFENIVHYIVNNPVKAKLVDDWKMWEQTWVADSLKKEINI